MEKTARITSLALVLICLVLYFVFPNPQEFGLCKGHLWSRLTYMWFHGNLLHYAINMYALCTLAFPCHINLKAFLTGLAVAISIPDFCLGSVPVVGISGWLFFMSGSLTYRMHVPFSWVFTNIIVIIVTSLLSHIAWGIHLWCYALGILFSYIETYKVRHQLTA